jgi:DNA-binding transcriptional LysR family regulator
MSQHIKCVAGGRLDMTIDIRHIRILLALAEEKNFTRAAARVGIPQPAISNQLLRIERTLGMRIFARTTRSVRLTEEGELLLPHLVSVHRSMSQLEDTARSRRSRVECRLRIGLTMPQAIEAIPMLRAKFPEVEFDITVGESDALTAKLCDGRLDAACVYFRLQPRLPNSRIRMATIIDEPVWALLSSTHPLAGTTVLPVSDLRDAAWVGAPAGAFEHELLGLLCQKADFEPRIAYQSAEFATRLALLRDNVVLGIGSPLVASLPELHVIPFDVELTQRVVLAWHNEEVPGPYAAGLLDVLDMCCGAPAHQRLIPSRSARIGQLSATTPPAAAA